MSRSMALLLLGLIGAIGVHASETDERALRETVAAFLAGVSAGDYRVHHSFWAEDLVYTSSAGRRFGKAELLASLADPDSEASGPRYSARELSVRFEQGIALVEFRLVAEQDGEPEQSFFNTGMFRQHDGRWQAFAWQATRAAVE